MKIIEIENKKYNFKTCKEDLLFPDYKDLLKVFEEREYEEVSANYGYTKLLEPIERGKESKEFINNKLLKIFSILCDRPLKKEMFDEFPELYKIVENLIDWQNLTNFETLEPNTLFIGNLELIYTSIENLVFQQWCDFESWYSEGFEYIFVCFFIKKDSNYDRFFLDKQKIFKTLNESKAIEYIPYIKYIFEYIYAVRNRYSNIYSQSESEGGSLNMKIHFDKFKWEDTIITIAESQLFNGPKGSLKAVREAKALEVLDYLEIKTHKNKAEYLDIKDAQNKPKSE